MKILFDPAKNLANIAKHGVALSEAKALDWQSALVWVDDRNTYGEQRLCALGFIGDRIYFVAFVDRDEVRRIISLRKANIRETKYYDNQT